MLTTLIVNIGLAGGSAGVPTDAELQWTILSPPLGSAVTGEPFDAAPVGTPAAWTLPGRD